MNHNEYITTGFATLDEAIGGFCPTELTIIGGRPAMGKSSMMISMMLNMANHHKISSVVFSLGKPVEAMARRMIKDMQEPYAEMPWLNLIYIDDTPSLSITALLEKCLRLKAEKNIQVVFIDYLQLLTLDDGTDRTLSETACMEQLLKSLKAIARELELPVVVFSQLKRSRDIGPNQPTLENFRESASVVRQLADKILFIDRPEYFYVGDDDNNNSIKGHAEIIIAKCAGCAVESIALRFDRERGRFSDSF